MERKPSGSSPAVDLVGYPGCCRAGKFFNIEGTSALVDDDDRVKVMVSTWGRSHLVDSTGVPLMTAHVVLAALGSGSDRFCWLSNGPVAGWMLEICHISKGRSG